MLLKDKTAVITGVSKGIGYHLAKELLSKGVRVFGIGRNRPEIEHSNFRFLEADVRSFENLEKAFDAIGNEIHILVNNAGLGYFGLLEETTVEQFHELYETNVFGTFYCCKLVLPVMKKQQYGHIINISSVAGLEGYPQVSAYCSTKFAVKGLTESLYKEVREDRIKVTCVYPGSVKTDFFRNSPGIKPHDYMLRPEDMATGIVQLLETPDNFHVVNYEVRPLQPKGPKQQQ